LLGTNFNVANPLDEDYTAFGKTKQRIDYNEGTTDFDVYVYQYDNYGLWLNKQGDTIDNTALYLNN